MSRMSCIVRKTGLAQSKKQQIISQGQKLLPKSDYRSQEILPPDLGLRKEPYQVKQKVQVKTTSHALREKNTLLLSLISSQITARCIIITHLTGTLESSEDL